MVMDFMEHHKRPADVLATMGKPGLATMGKPGLATMGKPGLATMGKPGLATIDFNITSPLISNSLSKASVTGGCLQPLHKHHNPIMHIPLAVNTYGCWGVISACLSIGHKEVISVWEAEPGG